MLPVKRVIASAKRSCHEAARCSRRCRARSASMFLSNTRPRPEVGDEAYVGFPSFTVVSFHIRNNLLLTCKYEHYESVPHGLVERSNTLELSAELQKSRRVKCRQEILDRRLRR